MFSYSCYDAEKTARPSQYKYQFKKWNVNKRSTVDEKKAVVAVLGKRMRVGMSTDDITIANADGSRKRKVDKVQLTRYLNQQNRRHEVASLSPGT